MLTIRQAIDRADFIDFIARDYAEPGYSNTTGKPILFANWNTRDHYDPDTRKFVTDDDTPRRLGDLAERAGYEIEWSDEWTTCDGCGKAVRTSPNSYSWTRSYFEDDNTSTVTCHECVKEDPSEYLEYLEGHDDRCETIGIDLTEHGYRKVNRDSYENGLHSGQNDSPQVIAKSLRARGIEHFIFKLDDVGQFDARFSVYVLDQELELLTDAPVESSLPYDIATEMAKALKSIPIPGPDARGTQVSSIVPADPESGSVFTVETRTLTPEEFVSGSWTKEKK